MRYGQRPGVSATEIDGDVFLVEPDTEEVFYLNVVAGGLWRALAEPMDLAELAALMHSAFPSAPRRNSMPTWPPRSRNSRAAAW